MAEYDQFIPGILIHVGTDCPRLVVMNTLKSTVREFCEKSGVWVYEHPDITISDHSQLDYPLDIPSLSYVCKVWSLHGRDKIAGYYGCPAYHLNANNRLVFDNDLPNGLTLLKPVLSLMPGQDALACPDFIYQNYYDIIVAGAVARMQLMPARAWFNPSLSMVHGQLFEAGVEKAKCDVEDGFGLARRPKRVNPFLQ